MSGRPREGEGRGVSKWVTPPTSGLVSLARGKGVASQNGLPRPRQGWSASHFSPSVPSCLVYDLLESPATLLPAA